MDRAAGRPTPLPRRPSKPRSPRSVAGRTNRSSMEQKNHAHFSAAKKRLEDELKARYDGKLFNRNYGWAAPALAPAPRRLCGWSAPRVVAERDGLADRLAIGCRWSRRRSRPCCGWRPRLRRVGKCLQADLRPCWFRDRGHCVRDAVPREALNSGRWLPLVLACSACRFVIFSLLVDAAPTAEGRGVLDHIAGFKQYLSITERERLDRMTPPEDTPEMFERYLPYAIALGVENHWADRFAACSPPRLRRASRASPGIRDRAARGPIPAGSPTASARRWRAPSARPRPRRDRAAARAAADSQAAVAAEAAAAAGRLTRPAAPEDWSARRDRRRPAGARTPAAPPASSMARCPAR